MDNTVVDQQPFVTKRASEALKSNKYTNLIIISSIGLVILVIIIGIFLMSRRNSSKDSLFAANTCPDELVEIDGKIAAVYQGKTSALSLANYEWIQANCNEPSTNDLAGQDEGTVDESISMDPPVLQNLGINFGKYDVMTGRAGAFIFDKDALKSNSPFPKIFLEFGSTKVDNGETITFPELVYSQVDADTDVTAMVEGTVFKINEQVESNDFSIEIRFNDNWMIIYDHVTALQIQQGDVVKSGDIIGKVGLNRDGITGFTEVAVKQGNGRDSSIEYCPVTLLAPSLKVQYESQLTELMNDWEIYYEDSSIYSQETQTTPGCIVDSFEITAE